MQRCMMLNCQGNYHCLSQTDANSLYCQMCSHLGFCCELLVDGDNHEIFASVRSLFWASWTARVSTSAEKRNLENTKVILFVDSSGGMHVGQW